MSLTASVVGISTAQVPPPDGLVVLGDAYCNFNPIYAQGMTVAAIEARLLGQLLSRRITQQPQPTNTIQCAARDSSTADDNTGVSTSNKAARAAVAAAVAGLNAEFYPAAAEVVGAAWAFAAGRDMLYPFAELRGEARSMGWRLMQEYVGAIFKVAAVDAEVGIHVIGN
jgi:2-polyprenyl-6-methoxyphenol hydroxylase-like FAD-dependent oxidoreductase